MSKTEKTKKKGKGKLAGRRSRSGFGIKFLKWSGVAAVWAFFVGLCFVAWLAYDLPSLGRLANAERRPSVTLVTSGGQILASYGDLYGKPVKLDELPEYLPDALLATEDRRFYKHFGLDLRGLLRAIVTNVRAGRLVQGGSTITQQLAKNVFLTADRTIRRKGQELLLAFWLERNMTKQQILELYLNRVYFGAGTYGVDAAARKYFGKPASKVTPFEAAMLAGMVRAPSRYNPINDSRQAAERGKLVLANMVAAGYMSDRDAQRAAAQGVANLKTPPAASGQYYADWVLDQVSGYVNYTDRDLVVVTTIDPQAQQGAEATVSKVLASDAAKNADQAAVVAMSPDGAVRALVGGRDYGDSQFNRATQALRQPGSAFKLFVFLAGMEAGLRPDDKLVDGPVSVGNWRPNNFDDRYYGTVTLREAFARSLNSVAVQVSERVGRSRVVETAHRLGITADLSATPSIALGASGVSLLEMTSAYAAFANRGNGVWPYGIEQILDAQGKVLYQRSGSGPGQVVGARAAGEMLDIMQSVVSWGTGRTAQMDRPVAGKTGTSQDYRDAWFIGFTADLVTGVWVGNDDNTPMNKVTGGTVPTRIWHDFMVLAEAGRPVRPLSSPAGELPMASLDPGATATIAPSAAPAAAPAAAEALGDNTPSPQIQSVIQQLRQRAADRRK
ncbi:MAG: penicillin-binding protein [Rhodospirillaceae bacterium]|nr:penicillin-binding protein [Rhodospirillaceae bacterium]